MLLPRLYPIVDAEVLKRRGVPLDGFAKELWQAGIRLLQFRDKCSPDQEVLEQAKVLRRVFPASESVLLLNDRAHLVSQAQFDGVHLGQGDLPPAEARKVLGRGAIIGLSTHNREQVEGALSRAVDYIAIGPVFRTATKRNPEAIVGLEGVRSARELTRLPLVGIGGIHGDNAREVFAAGADSVAVISSLLPENGRSTSHRVEEILGHNRGIG